MKKLIAILLIGILSVSLYGCSGTQTTQGDAHKVDENTKQNISEDADRTISEDNIQADAKADERNTSGDEQNNQKDFAASIADISLGDSKEKVIEVLGSNYKTTDHDEAGHFPESFAVWEYEEGFLVIIGSDSGKVFEIRSTSDGAETNLGAKVGDPAASVLALYRSKYEEPESIHGGQLKGVFKIENGAALIFDFDKEDGLVNQEPISGTDIVERIILTMPAYLDESF